ncbi:MAG: hypothetical protein LBU04_02810 [Christensenellaceae bacterium]|jgi:hypothetical protein|nr:hypothetical protein [Christensenellaceae bacterium]
MLIGVFNKAIGSTTALRKTTKEFLSQKDLDLSSDQMELQIVYHERKPSLKNAPPYVSLSHSANIIACVVAECQVGIDVEFMVERNFVELSKRYFSKTIADNREFYEYWTAGEAMSKRTDVPLVKVLKSGFFAPFRHVPIFPNLIVTISTERNFDENISVLDFYSNFSSNKSFTIYCPIENA